MVGRTPMIVFISCSLAYPVRPNITVISRALMSRLRSRTIGTGPYPDVSCFRRNTVPPPYFFTKVYLLHFFVTLNLAQLTLGENPSQVQNSDPRLQHSDKLHVVGDYDNRHSIFIKPPNDLSRSGSLIGGHSGIGLVREKELGIYR